ncbi:MAG: adenine phosphoribosyltransferase [Planctomycetes bacterium]|nr:adenine phosphoribosyltransferase [Planctomycetota bacterium]MCB9917597.1 adenine phosphoribosyltransferase [Planctomycetota bacterium]
MKLEDYIRDIPDFPKEGILFKDITPLLADANAFRLAITKLANEIDDCTATKIIGIESRGFVFGAALALELGYGFAPIRKKGKLPYDTVSYEYALEYGTDHVEMHVDAVEPGESVLVIDDLLATGGTVAAATHLIESVGGHVEAVAVLIELAFLGGRKKLGSHRFHAVLSYD